MTKKIILLAGFIVSTLFTSCKTENVEPSIINNNDQKIEGFRRNLKKGCKENEYDIRGHHLKGWIIYRYLVDGADSTEIVPECNLDNIIYLTKKGEYIDTEGRTKCNPASGNIYNQGSYVYLCETNQIALKSPNLTTTLDILELNANSLKVEFFDPSRNSKIQFWLKPALGRCIK